MRKNVLVLLFIFIAVMILENGAKARDIKGIKIAEKTSNKTSNKTAKKNKKFFMGLNYEAVAPVLAMADAYETGFGINIYIQYRNLFINNLFAGIELEFFYYGSSYKYTDWFINMPLYFTVGYFINIYSRFYIVPSVSTGICFGFLNYDKYGGIDMEKSSYEVEPGVNSTFKGGFSFRMTVTENIEASFGSFYGISIEKSGITSFIILSAGVGCFF